MLSPDTQLSDLMGSRGTKKGGMKGSYKSKAGPIKELEGVHPDGRPLTVSLQVCSAWARTQTQQTCIVHSKHLQQLQWLSPAHACQERAQRCGC
jgi:hypothetical protein